MKHPNYANLLPFEIWRECFMLLSIADHKALANTCHSFRNICLAFIFKSISYSSNLVFYKRSPVQFMEQQLLQLAKKVEQFEKLSNSQHAAHVRSCTLRYSLRLVAHTEENVTQAAKNVYDDFIGFFVKLIPAFTNLRQVHIEFQGKSMDKRILAAFAVLPQLEELSFSSVRFGVHLLKRRIKLRRLVIDNSDGSDSNPNPSSKLLDMFSGERLESLTVLSWSYAPKILRALTKQGTSKSLKDLSFQLRSKDIQDLYPFLASCPNLESLRVGLGTREDIKSISLAPIPRSTIPHLNSFRGPDIAAKVFIPGRPVRKVRLEYEKWADTREPTEMNGVFPHICQSTGPLTDLNIEVMEYGPEVLNLIATHFPKLTRLQLDLADRKIFINEDPHARKLDKSANENSIHLTDDADDTERSKRQLFDLDHSIYMNMLHWVALRRIDLPAPVETLYFRKYISRFIFEYDSDEELYDKPYSFLMALSIFETLSTHYPALRSVIVGDVNDRSKMLTWSKDMAGKWSYSEY